LPAITKEVDMSCSHGWHDCRPCGHGFYGGWDDPDWVEVPDRYTERRARGSRRRAVGMAAEDLEARLEDLRRMVRGIERDLEDLRGSREDAVT
jgi:hypothetical protein